MRKTLGLESCLTQRDRANLFLGDYRKRIALLTGLRRNLTVRRQGMIELPAHKLLKNQSDQSLGVH